MATEQIPVPDKQLVREVRAGFALQGKSLYGWCKEHRVDPGYAYRSLTGQHDFPKARELRARILKAARPPRAA